MKNLLLFLFFLSNICFAQTNEKDNQALDSLTSELEKIDKQILNLNSIKEELKREILIINQRREKREFTKPEGAGIKAIVSYSDSKLRTKPEISAELLFTIPFKDTVLVLDRHEKTKWLKVKYNGVYGYLLYNSLKENAELLSFIDNNASEKMIRLKKLYGDVIATRIIKKTYWIGMSNKMAEESLGQPDNINKTTGSWGVHEQWVYGKLYLYFENGKLTSYQN